MPYGSVGELKDALTGVVDIQQDHVVVKDEKTIRETLIDRWVRSAVFGDDDVKESVQHVGCRSQKDA